MAGTPRPREILLEAMQKDPQRLAIHAKLLEIYANRKSVKQFGKPRQRVVRPDRRRRSRMGEGRWPGAKLDPGNPLYTTGRASVGGAAEFDADATMVASAKSADVMRSTLTLPVGAWGRWRRGGFRNGAPADFGDVRRGGGHGGQAAQEVAPPAPPPGTN